MGEIVRQDILRADMIRLRELDDDILPVMDVLGLTSPKAANGADQGERRRCRAPRNRSWIRRQSDMPDCKRRHPSAFRNEHQAGDDSDRLRPLNTQDWRKIHALWFGKKYKKCCGRE